MPPFIISVPAVAGRMAQKIFSCQNYRFNTLENGFLAKEDVARSNRVTRSMFSRRR